MKYIVLQYFFDAQVYCECITARVPNITDLCNFLTRGWNIDIFYPVFHLWVHDTQMYPVRNQSTLTGSLGTFWRYSNVKRYGKPWSPRYSRLRVLYFCWHTNFQMIGHSCAIMRHINYQQDYSHFCKPLTVCQTHMITHCTITEICKYFFLFEYN